MALSVPSGVVTQASGWTPTGRTLFQEPLPQVLYGSGDATPVNTYTGPDGNKALNINLSGGTISVAVNPFGLQSGTMVIISGGPAGLSGLNVTAAVTTTLAGYNSGFQIGISGGQLALSGLNVIASVTTTLPGYSSGTQVGISGGQLALSGLIVEISGEAVTTSISGNAVTTSVSGNAVTTSISGNAVTTSISGNLIGGGIQVSGTVGVSGVVAIGSGSVAILSGAISIQSGIISISGGVQVSGTVAVSGIVQIGSGSINNLSGLVSLREWPSYTLTAFHSGPAGIGIIGLAHAGGAAGQSGMVLEITRVEVGITASGNINRLDLFRVNDSTVQMSGPAGTIVSYYSGNALSLASGFIETSSGLVSGTQSGVTAIESLYLEANSSGYLHNYTLDFNSWRMQNPMITSGQGFMAQMVSGIGVGTVSVDWIERYLS